MWLAAYSFLGDAPPIFMYAADLASDGQASPVVCPGYVVVPQCLYDEGIVGGFPVMLLIPGIAGAHIYT